MILFPHAKINLGLHLLGDRSDGYQEIRSILYPIGLCDILELIPGKKGQEAPIMTISGAIAHQASEEDLVLRAYRALPEQDRIPPPLIHLHKRIPPGAGLGGGSSDAAHLFRYYAKGRELDPLHSPFEVGDPLRQRAASLGSDVPFFLQDRPVLASGRGTDMTPFPIDLGGWYLVLIVPPLQVSTARAYKIAKGGGTLPFPERPYELDVQNWQGKLVNELQEPIFKENPEMERILEELDHAGAVYASMTGSGSGIYGLFEKEPEVLDLGNENFVWREELPPITSGPDNR